MTRIEHWLIRLYPRGWRHRYGAEFEALLMECRHSPCVALDVLLGALDAWIYSLNGRAPLHGGIRMQKPKGVKEVVAALLAIAGAGMLDLSTLALAAFARAEGRTWLAWVIVGAGLAATVGFVVIGGRQIKAARAQTT